MSQENSLILARDNFRLRRARSGLILFLINDRYIGKALDTYGEISRSETELLVQLAKRGSTIVEIGSNIGVHAIPLAQTIDDTGALIAFEPQRIFHQMLCANIALNGLFNVRTHQKGAGAALTLLIWLWARPLGSRLAPGLEQTDARGFRVTQ